MLARFMGFMLIAVALMTGGAEAVMALGTGGHETIATGEAWTLFSGQRLVDEGGLWGLVVPLIAQTPLWLMMFTMGAGLVMLGRRKPAPKRLFNRRRR